MMVGIERTGYKFSLMGQRVTVTHEVAADMAAHRLAVTFEDGRTETTEWQDQSVVISYSFRDPATGYYRHFAGHRNSPPLPDVFEIVPADGLTFEPRR